MGCASGTVEPVDSYAAPSGDSSGLAVIDRRFLDEADLPDALGASWGEYLDASERGLRKEALALATGLVDVLDAGPAEERERFAHWLTVALLDRSQHWHGQFGGGLTPTSDGYVLELGWALAVFPLTTRVVIPYVIEQALAERGGWPVRWLFQSAWLAYRLPPRVQQEIEQIIVALCGDGEPISALRLAARTDADARRWVNELDAHGYAGMTVGQEPRD